MTIIAISNVVGERGKVYFSLERSDDSMQRWRIPVSSSSEQVEMTLQKNPKVSARSVTMKPTTAQKVRPQQHPQQELPHLPPHRHP